MRNRFRTAKMIRKSNTALTRPFRSPMVCTGIGIPLGNRIATESSNAFREELTNGIELARVNVANAFAAFGDQARVAYLAYHTPNATSEARNHKVGKKTLRPKSERTRYKTVSTVHTAGDQYRVSRTMRK
jgi:hypothetical protein